MRSSVRFRCLKEKWGRVRFVNFSDEFYINFFLGRVLHSCSADNSFAFYTKGFPPFKLLSYKVNLVFDRKHKISRQKPHFYKTVALRKRHWAVLIRIKRQVK